MSNQFVIRLLNMSNSSIYYLIFLFVYFHPNYRILFLNRNGIFQSIRNATSGNGKPFYYNNLQTEGLKIRQYYTRSGLVMTSTGDDNKSSEDTASESKSESQVSSNSSKDNEGQVSQNEASVEEPKSDEGSQRNETQTEIQTEVPRRRSRIETYDEFARFRDSSRAPDSHLPLGPGPGYRNKSNKLFFKETLVVSVLLHKVLY